MNFTPVILKRSWLLGVFGMIPITLFVVFIDRVYLEQALLPYLGLSSLLIPLYVLFFELPHIIASLLGFADKVYIRHYKRQLGLGIPIIIMLTLGIADWNFATLVGLYLVLTMYHVMKQQTGVALVLGAPKNMLFHTWTWLGVGVTALANIVIFAPFLIPATAASGITIAVPLLFVGFVVTGMLIVYQNRATRAWLYIFGTVIMLIASFYFLTLGYVFLSVFVMRFAHDVIAFAFYITHEYNRNHDSIKNLLYRYLPGRPISILFAVPLIGIGVGFVLRELTISVQSLFTLTVLLSFTHYYLESFMWKRESLHRTYVRVG